MVTCAISRLLTYGEALGMHIKFEVNLTYNDGDKEIITMEGDYSHISDYVAAYDRLLRAVGFHEDTIKQYLQVE